jgi:uncharacterized BrkB/YihY/UPF0761 family membrane protein
MSDYRFDYKTETREGDVLLGIGTAIAALVVISLVVVFAGVKLIWLILPTTDSRLDAQRLLLNPIGPIVTCVAAFLLGIPIRKRYVVFGNAYLGTLMAAAAIIFGELVVCALQ